MDFQSFLVLTDEFSKLPRMTQRNVEDSLRPCSTQRAGLALGISRWGDSDSRSYSNSPGIVTGLSGFRTYL